ncbi:flocculation protein FLO11 [Biomphalaria glabrata]|nr:flocculation protein FLO11 [Biomphalaria glabrata]
MEIPVIHETTRLKSGAPISAPVLVSSTSNHFLHTVGSGKSIAAQLSVPEGSGLLDMHREELIVTTSLKPKTPAKPSFRKGGEDESSKSTQKGLHARLPSADSGIQADGGCDSLSRYRGKSFLSASDKNDFLVAEEGVSSSPGKSKSNTSGASGGYGGGQPQQKLPLVSRVVTLPSKSFFTTSAAATPATSSRTSNGVTPTPAARTPVPAARTSVTSQNVTLTSSHNAPKSSEQKNGLHVSSRNLPAKDALERSDSSESQHNASISNQNSNSPSKSTSNRKSDSNVSTNQNADTFNQSNHIQSTSEQNVINITPNVKVMSNQGVKIAISKNTVNIATAKTPSISGNSEMVRTTGGSTQPTLKFHVVNSARPNQPDANKARAPGSIALTRPLRLGAPSAPNSRPQTTVNINTQQPAAPSARGQPPPLPSQPPKVTTNSSMRAKPKIAPRPSIAPKPSPQSSPSRKSSSEATTSTEVGISSNTSHSNNNESTVVTEIPVSYRPALSGSQPSRVVEIPVKHIESAPRASAVNLSKPLSLGAPFPRLTPERQLHSRQSLYERIASEKERLNKYPIYENVLNIKDGFSFEDPSSRMKQAELILKQSDELINDALRMLSHSPSPLLLSPKPVKRNGFSSDLRNSPEGERIVEGSDASTVEREHRVPIFDVQSGKTYGGPRAVTPLSSSSSSPVDNAHVINTSAEKVKDVVWNERKSRIDAALSWLKTELATLREMDNTLISHFKKCQETIDALKTQRDVWEGLSEEGEDGDYWDDFEICEFNKKYLDSPGGSESSQLSPMQDVSLPVPQLHLPHSSPGHGGPSSNRRGSVTQDVEATL